MGVASAAGIEKWPGRGRAGDMSRRGLRCVERAGAPCCARGNDLGVDVSCGDHGPGVARLDSRMACAVFLFSFFSNSNQLTSLGVHVLSAKHGAPQSYFGTVYNYKEISKKKVQILLNLQTITIAS